ncbi:MAG: class I SAM-dependent methyltransferase [Betaproteobacteria bacterium]|nr:class I SAM-dependent methyltransferase [Betaproteobacteria bacterium]
MRSLRTPSSSSATVGSPSSTTLRVTSRAADESLALKARETAVSTSSTFAAADGDGYELNMGRWSRILAHRFLDFVGLPGRERVLDVGCGTGHLAAAVAIASDAAEIQGIDLAPEYIAYARSRNTDPRITFGVGDACALEFPDGAFDRVLSLLVLHFVPRAEQAIAEIKRVTRPGGVAGAAVWDARGGWVANRLFFDTAAVLDPKAGERRARNYTRPLTRPGELAAAWHRAGFCDVSETTLLIRMEFESFADYWAPYLGRDGPGAEYVRTLDASQRLRLEEAVRAAYIDGEADGPRSFAALAHAVKGRRPE